MLSDSEITEIECIFILIDNNVIPHNVTLKFLDWLKNKNIERFALLDWMLRRWVLLRQSKYDLPKRFTNHRVVQLPLRGSLINLTHLI